MVYLTIANLDQSSLPGFPRAEEPLGPIRNLWCPVTSHHPYGLRYIFFDGSFVTYEMTFFGGMTIN